jgi:hypothetical protein
VITTFAPARAASSAESPGVSYKEGNTNVSHAAYADARREESWGKGCRIFIFGLFLITVRHLFV